MGFPLFNFGEKGFQGGPNLGFGGNLVFGEKGFNKISSVKKNSGGTRIFFLGGGPKMVQVKIFAKERGKTARGSKLGKREWV